MNAQSISLGWLGERVLAFVLGVGLLAGWLSWRPASPQAALDQLAAIRCGEYVSETPDSLVPAEAVAGRVYEPPLAAYIPEPAPLPPAFSLRWRIGVGVPDPSPYFYDWMTPRPGWYLNWQAYPIGGDAPNYGGLGMEFLPMVRVRQGLYPDPRTLFRLAQEKPGQTWLIGNEPDVRWQGDATPEEYACLYHVAYHAIKLGDPTAQVAIGGVSQITPLRLQYLDAILASYRSQWGVEMPVDVWNMHAFVLREEADAWGVGIPPGFDHVRQGELWEIEDHDDLSLVAEQVRRMRAWMAAHGQREKPLYITEYGILMPNDYGFPPSRVIDFLVGSFDLFLELRDDGTGYPADDNRLVQRWCWFSTRDHLYPTGDLFRRDGSPTPIMRAISGYMRAREER